MNSRQLLNRWLQPHGYHLARTRPVLLRERAAFDVDFDFLVRYELFRDRERFCFVQIGANDGVSREDDLVHYALTHHVGGVLVEPQPEPFAGLAERLRAHPNVRLVNKAVHATDRRRTLYRLDLAKLQGVSDLPLWARTNGIASFDRAHVLEHVRRIGLDESVVCAIEVPCVTLPDLLAELSSTPNVLKIDVEGYDSEILNTVDLARCKPAIVRFEHLHMSGSEYEALVRRFAAEGYRFLENRLDTVAFLDKGRTSEPH